MAAAAAVVPAVVASTTRTSSKKKNKKQRRLERQAAANAEAESQQRVPTQPTFVEPSPDPTPEPEPTGLRDFTDDDGARCIEGYVEAVFQPGQKRTYAHVAFNPTFSRKPEVVCEVADDSSARLKAPQAFSYGTRLELTRKEDVQNREVVRIGLFARAEPT